MEYSMNGKNSTTPAHRKPSALDRLHELDELVEQHQDRDRQELFYLLARGKHHLSMTSHRQAVRDLREALEIQREIAGSSSEPKPNDPVVSPYAVLSHLGDAIRLDTRDRLFSMAPGSEEQRAVLVAIAESIRYFDQALALYEQQPSKNIEHKAWLLAHKGASITMRCFFGVTARRPEDFEDDFAAAEVCFRDAIALVETQEVTVVEVEGQQAKKVKRPKRYPWAGRFLAFLLALHARPARRGDRSDFELARAELEKLGDTTSDHLQSALWDSTSMLYSYSAFADSRAAQEGVDAAVACLAVDSEAFRAAHSKAVCMAALSLHAPDDPQRKANVKAAIESARTCAADALAQASVIMASLALTEALIDGEGIPEAVERMNGVREAFRNMGIHPSMEAASMIERSAIWASVKRYVEQATEEEQGTHLYKHCSSLMHQLVPGYGDLHAAYAKVL
jgi:hypothetical protein